jgi:hypothetical protein
MPQSKADADESEPLGHIVNYLLALPSFLTLVSVHPEDLTVFFFRVGPVILQMEIDCL